MRLAHMYSAPCTMFLHHVINAILAERSTSLSVVHKIGQRIVDYVEFVDFSRKLLLDVTEAVVVAKPIGSVDRVLQLPPQCIVVLLQPMILCLHGLHIHQR